MSVHRILIDTTESAATFEGFVNPQSSKRSMLTKLGDYLQAIAGSSKSARVRLHASGVCSTNKITLASHVAADYVTLNGVVLTCTSGTPTNVQYKVGAGTDDSVTSNNLRSCINACTSAKVNGIVHAYKYGTITASTVIDTNYVTINDVKFIICDTTGIVYDASNPLTVALGEDDTTTMANLAASINKVAVYHPNLAGLVSCTAASGVVSMIIDNDLLLVPSGGTLVVVDEIVKVDFTIPGAVGNLGTLAISARGSVTGANFASGSDGNEYTYLTV